MIVHLDPLKKEEEASLKKKKKKASLANSNDVNLSRTQLLSFG
jgi:hypothetical protein